MPVGIIAKLQVQPEHIEEFEHKFVEYQQTVRHEEAGNLFFCLHKSREQVGSYIVMEQYADETAFAVHQSAEYYQAIPEVFGYMMAAPPDIQVLDSIG